MTKQGQPKVNFRGIEEKEERDFLKACLVRGLDLVFWWNSKKSSTHRLVNYSDKRRTLDLEPSDKFEGANDKVFTVNVTLNGIQYFSKAKIEKEMGEEGVRFALTEKIYKTERRKNFRVNVYGKHKVHINLDLGSNINLNNLREVKSVFHEFLAVLEAEKNFLLGGEVTFPVRDLSISGACFEIPVQAKTIFEKKGSFENVKIDFEGSVFSIKEARFVYTMNSPYPGDNQAEKLKAAIHFSQITKEVEEKLLKQLSTKANEGDLRKYFEKFIK